jgi:hypothetical protein
MTLNPNFEKKKDIEAAVVAAWEMANPGRFFAPIKISEGKQLLQRKFAKMPKIPAAMKEIIEYEVDKFRTENGTYRIPRFAEKIEMSMDEYEEMLADGDFAGVAANLAAAMAVSVGKATFQNVIASLGANDFPYYGVADGGNGVLATTGNGTRNRPITAGAGTKRGAWTTAAYGLGDLGEIKGHVLKHKPFDDGTPLVLFAPSIIQTQFNTLVPGLTNGMYIGEAAQKVYGAIETVGDDDNSLCIMTAAAETATNFAMVTVNPNWFLTLFDKAPKARVWFNEDETKVFVGLEVHQGVMPIPLEEADGKIYKAMSYIDTCGA